MPKLLEKLVDREDDDFVYGRDIFEDGTVIPYMKPKPDYLPGYIWANLPVRYYDGKTFTESDHTLRCKVLRDNPATYISAIVVDYPLKLAPTYWKTETFRK